MGKKRDRDVEKIYSTAEFVAKLRRLADALEADERFEIQVAGERIYVPVRAEFNIEHEREGDGEELEFQLKWTNASRVLPLCPHFRTLEPLVRSVGGSNREGRGIP